MYKQARLNIVYQNITEMAESFASPEELVIKFAQKDFLDLLWSKSPDLFKKFTVESIDNGDVLNVSVSLIPNRQEKCKNADHVGFKLVESLPEDEKERGQLAAEVFKELGDVKVTQQIVFLVGRNDIKAYTKESADGASKERRVLLHPQKEELYSRSRGILESALLEGKKVAIIGLGSGGSHIAIELAKAGVGRFVLIDYDRIELSNIIRHTCGIRDLGRFKTKAIRDQILEKNLFAEVEIHNININDIEKAVSNEIGLKDCDLIVAATDNSRSRLNINDIAYEFNIPALFGQCRQRASGGAVVVVRPGQGPCFSCICGGSSGNEEVSSFRQAREAAPTYVSDSEVEATIQVGLSSDIFPISNMVVKIALVELCKGKDTALSCLEEDFRSFYYVWANRSDANYFEKYEDHGLEGFDRNQSILRWYAVANTESAKGCTTCNYKEETDDGESDE